MLFGKTKLELKVGIFVFIGIVVLVIFVLSIGGFKTWSEGYRVGFSFDFVNGVKIGAPVRYAGVDIGQIKEINFRRNDLNETKVDIVGWVKKEVQIPVDSTIWINTLGLLGEKYIEVMPGKELNNFVKANTVLEGHNPIAMHEVSDLIKNIVDDIDDLIVQIKTGQGTIGKLFVDDAIYNEVESLVLDLKSHPWKLFWKK
ncbi:MAG: MlaD family protein [Candidatus Omnitrophota bacterium]